DKDLIDGPVSRVTAQAVFAELRLEHGSAGGPGFSESGELVGISALDGDAGGRRARQAGVGPIGQGCHTVARGGREGATQAAPAEARLPAAPAVKASASRDDKASKTQPPALSSSNFDITLLSASLAREATSQNGPKSDFGNWNEYVRRAPPVIMIRVSPQFE